MDMRSRVRCVLFDLGGTLWQRKRRGWREQELDAHRRAGALLGSRLPGPSATELEELLGRLLHRDLNQLRRTMIAASPESEPNGLAAVASVLAGWGVVDADQAWAGQLYEALDVPLARTRRLFDDSLAGLAELGARGYDLGVVTNRFWGGPAFVRGMEELGLLSSFDAEKMAVSADLGWRKPARSIYEHALRAHRVGPEEVAMVGNSLPADVVGAQELGILAVWKPAPRLLPLVKAHLAHHGITLAQYNAGHRLPEGSRLEGPAAAGLPNPFDSHFADLLQHSQVWERFLLGAVRPDLIVENVAELSRLLGLNPPWAGLRAAGRDASRRAPSRSAS